MRSRIAALMTALLVLFSGCAGRGSYSDSMRVYYTSLYTGEMSKLIDFEACQPNPGMDRVSYLFSRMKEEPKSVSMKPAIPQDSEIESSSIQDGMLTLRLTGSYSALTGAAMTIADCCLTLTMTQLESVNGICIENAGPGLSNSKIFYPEDFVLNDLKVKMIDREITLFFWNGETGDLGPESRVVKTRESESLERYVVEELIKGPVYEEFSAAIPRGTRLLSAVTEADSGICYVNLSAGFLNFDDKSDQADKAVESLVRTLCVIPDISKVQILIDGEKMESVSGVLIGRPLEYK